MSAFICAVDTGENRRTYLVELSDYIPFIDDSEGACWNNKNRSTSLLPDLKDDCNRNRQKTPPAQLKPLAKPALSDLTEMMKNSSLHRSLPRTGSSGEQTEQVHNVEDTYLEREDASVKWLGRYPQSFVSGPHFSSAALMTQAAANCPYQLSDDFRQKQVEILERKYGGASVAQRAATVVQRAYRDYCMAKKWRQVCNSQRRKLTRFRTSDESNAPPSYRAPTGLNFTTDKNDLLCYGRPSFKDVKPIYESVQQQRGWASQPQQPSLITGRTSLAAKLRLHKYPDPPKDKKPQPQQKRSPLSVAPQSRAGNVDDTSKRMENTSQDAFTHQTNNSSRSAANVRFSYPKNYTSRVSIPVNPPHCSPSASSNNPPGVRISYSSVENRHRSISAERHRFFTTGVAARPKKCSVPQVFLSPRAEVLGETVVGGCSDFVRGMQDSCELLSPETSFIGSDSFDGQSCSPYGALTDIRSPEVEYADYQPLRSANARTGGRQRTDSSHSNSGDKFQFNTGPNYGHALVDIGRKHSASPVWLPHPVDRNVRDRSPLSPIPHPPSTSKSETAIAEAIVGNSGATTGIPLTERDDAPVVQAERRVPPAQRRASTGTQAARNTNGPCAAVEQRVVEFERKRQYRIALNFFNKKPDRGMQFLIDFGFVENSAEAVGKFLLSRRGLSKQMIGEYLGNLQNPFNGAVLQVFVNLIDLSGMELDVALRKFQSLFRLPGEAQKIERIIEVFSRRYRECNAARVAELFAEPETVFILAFAVIMLNVDLHHPQLKAGRRMKPEDFRRNLAKIDGGGDLDPEFLAEVYRRVKAEEFRPGGDHVAQVLKVDRSITGKKPTLALPHRRLVCYCRLYEIEEPSKKQNLTAHQREIFLFNDLIMITKCLNRKKNAVTYGYRQSHSLVGTQVHSFRNQHYKYGIKICHSLENRENFFHARNQEDQAKFMEDLRESIIESDEMEALRIELELEKQSRVRLFGSAAVGVLANRTDSAQQRDSGLPDLVNDADAVMVGRLCRAHRALSSSMLELASAAETRQDGGETPIAAQPRRRRGSVNSLDSGMSSTASVESPEDSSPQSRNKRSVGCSTGATGTLVPSDTSRHTCKTGLTKTDRKSEV